MQRAPPQERAQVCEPGRGGLDFQISVPPPRLLAAGGRLTINGLMVLKHLFAADLGQTPLRFTPDFDCEDKKSEENFTVPNFFDFWGSESAFFFVSSTL